MRGVGMIPRHLCTWGGDERLAGQGYRVAREAEGRGSDFAIWFAVVAWSMMRSVPKDNVPAGVPVFLCLNVKFSLHLQVLHL